jgi:hypothetical protein
MNDRSDHLAWDPNDVEHAPVKDNDPVIDYLKKSNLPVTRENYIEANWSPVPKPWTAEHESELPENLQDFSHVKPGDDE